MPVRDVDFLFADIVIRSRILIDRFFMCRINVSVSIRIGIRKVFKCILPDFLPVNHDRQCHRLSVRIRLAVAVKRDRDRFRPFSIPVIVIIPHLADGIVILL